MPAYYGQWRLICDQPVSPELVAQARKLVGGMLETGGIPAKSVRNPDGSAISVIIVNNVPKVMIVPPPNPKQPQPLFSTQWVPRGFVVYPAWHAQPYGVGLPVVQQGTDPYAPENLSPGLSTTRWTADGPCGEVLVSPDTQAGYPPEPLIPAPLLADASAGPMFLQSGTENFDARTPAGAWTSYRLELEPFVAHYSDENSATQQALFEAVNLARTNAGQDAGIQGFRGYARVAEIAASVMVTAGTTVDTSTSYPLAYQSSADRLTKEGYSVDWTDTTQASFTRADIFAAEEFRASGGTPSTVVAGWQTQPGSLLTANLGPSVVANVGYRGGVSVLALAARDRWIQAGNASWQSADQQLPPISWHSFASVNLAWETYPATYTGQSATPIAPLHDFTGTTGDCWLFYPRSTTVAPCYYDGAMGRHIYSRGRSIALAPNGGLVWGACVAPNGANDRLIALVHHAADQPSDTQVEGFTRYLRVWWADIPRRDSGQRLAPQLTICGTDATDPWGWRGGDLVDLGSFPAPSSGFVAATPTMNSLKYASVWKFATDGLRAACLRDYGSLSDYTALGGVDWSVGSTVPRTVELVFSISGADLTVSPIFHDYTAGCVAPSRSLGSSTVPGCADSVSAGNALVENPTTPLAVDYDVNGLLVYAYTAAITPDTTPIYARNVFRGYALAYTYVGTGDASTTYPTDMAQRVLIGATMATPALQQAVGVPLALDVNNAVFACLVGLPAYTTNPAAWPDPHSGVATFDRNPGYLCPTYTDAAVAGVQLSRGGSVVSTDWYANPDGELNTPFFPCIETGAPGGAVSYLPLAVSANLQGHYASRFGQTVYGYQSAPVPQAALMMNASPSGTDGCGCQYTVSEFASSAMASMTQQAPRGGKVASSVPLPANDWLIYSKVV